MSVRQVDIAERVGLDVSSVNKILNHKPGAIFREETVKRVLAIAKEMGWKANPRSKFAALRKVEVLEARVAALEMENKGLKDQLSAIQKVSKSA